MIIGSGAYGHVVKTSEAISRVSDNTRQVIQITRAVKKPMEHEAIKARRATDYPDPIPDDLTHEILVLREISRFQQEYQEMIQDAHFTKAKLSSPEERSNYRNKMHEHFSNHPQAQTGATNIIYLAKVKVVHEHTESKTSKVKKPNSAGRLSSASEIEQNSTNQAFGKGFGGSMGFNFDPLTGSSSASTHSLRSKAKLTKSISTSRPKLNLVYEYAEITLHSHLNSLREIGKKLTDDVVRSIMFQLTQGLAFLHSNWIIHRDLKPANILIMNDAFQQGVVKIGDFGLARFLRTPLLPMRTQVVTLWYRAPELLLGSNHYTHAVDVWSLGCIFGELLDLADQSTIRHYFPMAGQLLSESTPIFEKDQVFRVLNILGKPTATEDSGVNNEEEEEEHLTKRDPSNNVKTPTEQPPPPPPSHTDWPSLSTMPYYVKFKSQVLDDWEQLCKQKNPPSGIQFRDALRSHRLLKRFLTYDPSARITPQEALKHDYFRGMTHSKSIAILKNYLSTWTSSTSKWSKNNTNTSDSHSNINNNNNRPANTNHPRYHRGSSDRTSASIYNPADTRNRGGHGHGSHNSHNNNPRYIPPRAPARYPGQPTKPKRYH